MRARSQHCRTSPECARTVAATSFASTVPGGGPGSAAAAIAVDEACLPRAGDGEEGGGAAGDAGWDVKTAAGSASGCATGRGGAGADSCVSLTASVVAGRDRLFRPAARRAGAWAVALVAISGSVFGRSA